MGSTSDKISGTANEVAGKVKQGLGKATGNDQLRAEGLDNILVNTGEFRALGSMPDGAAWPVQLTTGGDVPLVNRALASSGSFFCVAEDGERFEAEVPEFALVAEVEAAETIEAVQAIEHCRARLGGACRIDHHKALRGQIFAQRLADRRLVVEHERPRKIVEVGQRAGQHHVGRGCIGRSAGHVAEHDDRGTQPLGKAGFKPKIHDISPLESAGFSQKRGKRATPGIAAMGGML